MSLIRNIEWFIPIGDIQEEPVLIYTSCDSNYLNFATALINSIELFSPGFSILLHIINPSDNDLKVAKSLSEKLHTTRLYVSLEHTDLSDYDPDVKKAYYASARFIHLADVLPRVNVPIFSLDADSIVVNPIQLDFSDKPETEVCLVRRNLVETVELHKAVLMTSLWLRPTDRTKEFMSEVAKNIISAFVKKKAKWFVDQIIFAQVIEEMSAQVHVRNLKKKYADCTFSVRSIVWAGKGASKYLNMQFFLLQHLLMDDIFEQVRAIRMLNEFKSEGLQLKEWIHARLEAVVALVPPFVILYLPRLDLPWKKPLEGRLTPPPVIADDVVDLRMQWKLFTLQLANAIERLGLNVEIKEIPAWELDRQMVEASGASLALIPHHCHLNFEDGQTPVMYYMQEYFRWVFVVDQCGWSASSSVYPVELNDISKNEESNDKKDSFDDYRRRLLTRELSSKFLQPNRLTRRELLKLKEIPKEDFIFFPLQIPDDQSIRYFSDVSLMEVFEQLLEWACREGIPLVIKPHPVNKNKMRKFKKIFDKYNAIQMAQPKLWWEKYNSKSLFWSNANIQDLVENAKAVYTINSGVGFEALLNLKPVVTFGRAEYDCVTHRATLDSLDDAWDYCQVVDSRLLDENYRKFVNWFLGEYAVDLSVPEIATNRLNHIAKDIVDRIRK